MRQKVQGGGRVETEEAILRLDMSQRQSRQRTGPRAPAEDAPDPGETLQWVNWDLAMATMFAPECHPSQNQCRLELAVMCGYCDSECGILEKKFKGCGNRQSRNWGFSQIGPRSR